MIFLPFMKGRLYSMVIFFPLSVTSAVPGGLGRLLLSACGAAATAASTKIATGRARRMRLFCMWIPFSCELQMRGHIIRQNEARDKYSPSAALATRVDRRKCERAERRRKAGARRGPRPRG